MKRFRIDKNSLGVSILGGVLFAAIMLLPYLIHSSNYFYTAAINGANFRVGDCVSHLSLKDPQCLQYGSPDSAKIVIIAGIVALLIYAVLVLRYSKQLHIQKIKAFTSMHLVISIVAAAASIIAFLIMRGVAQNQVFSVYLPAHGGIPPNPGYSLGYGLRPAPAVIFSVLYLAAPLLLWYLVRFSRLYIGGVKKEELFQ